MIASFLCFEEEVPETETGHSMRARAIERKRGGKTGGKGLLFSGLQICMFARENAATHCNTLQQEYLHSADCFFTIHCAGLLVFSLCTLWIKRGRCEKRGCRSRHLIQRGGERENEGERDRESQNEKTERERERERERAPECDPPHIHAPCLPLTNIYMYVFVYL